MTKEQEQKQSRTKQEDMISALSMALAEATAGDLEDLIIVTHRNDGLGSHTVISDDYLRGAGMFAIAQAHFLAKATAATVENNARH